MLDGLALHVQLQAPASHSAYPLSLDDAPWSVLLPKAVCTHAGGFFWGARHACLCQGSQSCPSSPLARVKHVERGDEGFF